MPTPNKEEVVSVGSTNNGESQNTQAVITTFMDDGIAQETSLLLQQNQNPQASRDEFKSLYTFLERPILVQQGKWADTDVDIPINDFDSKGVFPSRLYNGVFPSALLNANPAMIDKLNNFALLRADVKVQIKVNSQPFQAGKLWLTFTPFQNNVDPASLEVKSYKGGITGFPGVEIDLATSNTGVLKIPFCSFREAYNLITGTGEFGNFDLWVLLPLRDGTVSYSIYANLENINLSVPAPSTNALKTHMLRAKAQGLFKSEDKSAQSSNVLSGIAGTVGNVAGAVSNIPVIGKFAAPVSWVANAASGVLGALGFSKPENTAASSLISWKPVKSMGYVEGSDDSTLLACLPDNSLAFPNKIFPTDVDEMSFNFVKSRPTVFYQGTWTTSDEAGDILTSFPVNPTFCPTATFDAGVTYFATLLGYLANPAALWRGGITYRIAFAKTAYHSGRIRVSFWPFTEPGNTNEMQNAYNVIIDLRESSEITFTIPYVSSLPWQKVSFGTKNFDIDTTGTVAIEVLNDLVASSIASETIDYIITIAGADDFELAGWGIGDYGDTNTTLIPAIEELSVTAPNKPVAQIYEYPTSHSNIEPAPAMNLLNTLSSSDYAKENCIGEDIQSIRSLIKRYGYLGDLTTSEVGLSGLIAPMGILNDGTFQTWLPSGNTNFKNMPFVNYFANIFRFYRGAERFKIFHVGNTTDNASIRATLGSGTICPPLVMQTYQNGAVTEITRPFYHGATKRIVYGTAQSYRPIHVLANGFMDGSGQLYAAAGDDFSFGWLIGPNPLVVFTGNASIVTPGSPKPTTGSGGGGGTSSEITIVGCDVALPMAFGAISTPTVVSLANPLPVNGDSSLGEVKITGCTVPLPIAWNSTTTPLIVSATNPLPTTGSGTSPSMSFGIEEVESFDNIQVTSTSQYYGGMHTFTAGTMLVIDAVGDSYIHDGKLGNAGSLYDLGMHRESDAITFRMSLTETTNDSPDSGDVGTNFHSIGYYIVVEEGNYRFTAKNVQYEGTQPLSLTYSLSKVINA